MKESAFQSKLIAFLKSKTAWVFNIHGSEWQKPGVPDLLVIHRSWKGFLECKVTAKIEPIQRKVMKDIIARGFPCFVIKPDGIYNEDNEFLMEWNRNTLLDTLNVLSEKIRI